MVMMLSYGDLYGMAEPISVYDESGQKIPTTVHWYSHPAMECFRDFADRAALIRVDNRKPKAGWEIRRGNIAYRFDVNGIERWPVGLIVLRREITPDMVWKAVWMNRYESPLMENFSSFRSRW